MLKINAAMAEANAPAPLWEKLLTGFLRFVIFSQIAICIALGFQIHFLNSRPQQPLLSVKSVNNLTVDASNPAAGARFRLTTVVGPKPTDASASFVFVKGVSWVTYGNSTNSSITAFSERTNLLRLDFSMENITGADAYRLGKEVREKGVLSFKLNFDSIVSWKKHKGWLRGQFHQVYSCPISLRLARTRNSSINPSIFRGILGNVVSSNSTSIHGIVKDGAFFMVNDFCVRLY